MSDGSSAEIQFTIADLHDLAHGAHIVEMLDHYARHPMGQGAPLDDEVRERLLPGLRQHGGCEVILAYRDDRPVGAAICFRGFSSFKAAPLLNIHDFVIHESARGQGVGRLLMDAICDHASQLGCCRVTLEVDNENHPAKALYRKCGFAADGDSQLFWKKVLN